MNNVAVEAWRVVIKVLLSSREEKILWLYVSVQYFEILFGF